MEDKYAIPGYPAFNLTERDREILSQTDEEYHLQTWDDLKEIIGNNDLQLLTRLPSQLKKYLAWTTKTKEEYGDMTTFLLQKRLYWEPKPSTDPAAPPTFPYKNPVPFANRSDYRILVNDWPYGLSPGIKHICVWLKVRLPLVESGDLSDNGREMVERFVDDTFVKGLGVEGQDRVQWFKNWAGLQSVQGIEHIHVLLRDVDEDKLAGVVETLGEPLVKDVN
ncbi:hypothetical protein EJ08DRAFT_180166 [Tothia fuscella]|uniref:N-acetylglucosamine-induced protein 1 n=1 Tax=Tothia fuscella TaxID=1048955 RepID=A0A9P4NUF4_9PEZI|nr:hypothetical protein EJ08DRAFT_180166 [Tothia fuscella]